MVPEHLGTTATNSGPRHKHKGQHLLAHCWRMFATGFHGTRPSESVGRAGSSSQVLGKRAQPIDFRVHPARRECVDTFPAINPVSRQDSRRAHFKITEPQVVDLKIPSNVRERFHRSYPSLCQRHMDS